MGSGSRRFFSEARRAIWIIPSWAGPFNRSSWLDARAYRFRKMLVLIQEKMPDARFREACAFCAEVTKCHAELSVLPVSQLHACLYGLY
jgi:hypothetical protein